MIVKPDTSISEMLKSYPECIEFLWPFRYAVSEGILVEELAQRYELPLEALILGLERTVKRAVQYPFNYSAMRRKLVKLNAVNVAGYANFTWQNQLIDELKSFAKREKIKLNLNIFPKFKKKEFQNYMAVCKSVDDLPDILIGKGFSTFNTQQFVDSYVRTGDYKRKLNIQYNKEFKHAGLIDSGNNYHVFGAEEFVMLFDKMQAPGLQVPVSWDDLLKPEYKGRISQMGKSIRDHFAFVMMLYTYCKHGEDGIRQYAGNVKSKQHFTSMVKNMGREITEAAPINVMHNFAKNFIRSDIRNDVMLVNPIDGNPVISLFLLVKSKAHEDALKIAKHFYSPEIGQILEKTGSIHAAKNLGIGK